MFTLGEDLPPVPALVLALARLKLFFQLNQSLLPCYSMKPTYEELNAELVETKRKLVEATDLLHLALEEIADLKEKLNLNSKNSSKPPSTDQKSNTTNMDRKKRKSRKGFART
jgi:hypothetical protein